MSNPMATTAPTKAMWNVSDSTELPERVCMPLGLRSSSSSRPVLSDLGRATDMSTALAWPRDAPMRAKITPPTTPVNMPTVAAVNATEVTSGWPLAANTSPIAAEVPNPPDHEAKRMSPIDIGASNTGRSRSMASNMPTNTCPADMRMP